VEKLKLTVALAEDIGAAMAEEYDEEKVEE
jgi:hypothetical protein